MCSNEYSLAAELLQGVNTAGLSTCTIGWRQVLHQNLLIELGPKASFIKKLIHLLFRFSLISKNPNCHDGWIQTGHVLQSFRPALWKTWAVCQ